MGKETKNRDQIDKKYKWNIEAMYADEEQWKKDYQIVEEKAKDFKSYAGRLGESPQVLLEAFQKKDTIWLILERVYVYARMKKDEDNQVNKYQAMSDKASSLIAKTSSYLSFFTPELLDIPEDKLKGFIAAEEGLKLYEHAINEFLREKAHVLSQTEENLLAQISEIASSTNDIFTMINNADIKFGTITDEDGDEVEVTHGRYIGFMESHDQRVRKDAYEHVYQAYGQLKNTLATTYNYNTKTDVITARIRKYESALHAALSGDNIPISVYDNLIETVNSRLDLLHRYVEVRRKLLGVQDVHMYDMYVPLVELPKEEIPYQKSLDMMREGLAPLGDDYLQKMNRGIEAGWIDVYENQGKTSGAYSFGSYDSMPYILLNYNGKLKDVFTLVHEMGHSMHSYYTRHNQPFIYGGHSIFTAEVASTVNESLLIHHLLENTKDPEKKKYLLNLYIEEFRTTLFRQTMFAEFERLTHYAVENGEVLTAEWLSDEYGKLNKKYFGPKVSYDPLIEMEWSRIPHFYKAFYVYKYATGFSAASAISEEILKKGQPARDAYIEFLKSGDSDDPIELLKIAGVDMSRPEPIEKAMNAFETLIVEIEKLV
ncbi:oligoendopeptidase F [Sinanaerobacter chloroacetimidivorans]|uniref:Oligopeptidase F n=1 Tax=Sinanaerobacter chloroacetimidivorans TaxID=2818044 RepID=A0A8J8B3U4_9FIRM|nr:oligoendopeptidase F [Sinanaerobacter chloroacetimidivorans]MBR0600131.1 oligoendopeptidase F [Sinanaerobacter chloroacetimidivorans]